MPRVLVVGCGFVGEAAADLFQGAGWDVTGWTHSAESAARLGSVKPYRVEAHDITDPGHVREAARTLLPGGGALDVLVNCVSSGRGGGPEAYRRVYLEGARNLRAAFRATRFVYTGSTSVYAQTDGLGVDENSPAEDVVLAVPGGTVARLAGIYGRGRSALLRNFLAGEATIEGDGGRWLNQIHRDDAAAALFRLAQPDAPPGIYNVADDSPLTQLSLYQGLAAHFGRELPPHGPEDRNRKRGWTSKHVLNGRLRASGWRPRWGSFLDWAREEGSLTASP